MKKHSFGRCAATGILVFMVAMASSSTAAPADWKSMITIAEVKRDAQGNLLPLQSYDETIRRGMSFLLNDHLKWFKGPPDTLLDESGHTRMPWVYYSNLQHNGEPFASSVDRFVSYPAFHHAMMIRTFIKCWRYAKDDRALEQAVKLADWNIAHSTPGDWAYGSLPYSTFQEKKPGGFRDKTGLMPDKAAIMALAYLQLHEATREARFLRAAEAIGRTLSKRQRSNGTWPFRVDPKTEKVVEEYTSSVIYAVMLFEKLDKINGNDRYRANRDLAWKWLLSGPVKTKEFRGFYEDIPASPKGRTNYDCLDTIRYLLANSTDENGYLEMAKDLNAWVEKTFLDKIKGFGPAEGIREQLQCNVVMGVHSLNWASMLLELSAATGDEKMRQRAIQTANYVTYYLQPDNRIVVGFAYHQWWYSCHTGAILYLLDFVDNKQDSAGLLRLENKHIAVQIDRKTGAIRSIRDKEQGVTYPFSGIGFDVTTEAGSVRSESATEVKPGKDGAELRFTAGGLETSLFYSLGPEDRFIEKWLEIRSEDGKPYFLKSVALEDMTSEAFTEIHFHDDQTIWHCPINLFLRGEKGGCFAGLEYPYWELKQKGKEGFRLSYQPNYQVERGEVNITEKYFIGVYRKEGIHRISQGPYPGRGRYKALSWGGKAGLIQHFKARRIPPEVEDVPLETLDWGEVWAMQEFMRHVLPDDLPLPEEGFWVWQNGWWAGIWNIKPEILDRLKEAGIRDVMTAHTWYGRGNHPISPPYIDQMRIEPMGFPKDSGVAGMPGPAGPAAGLHGNHKDVKLDSFVPGKYTPEFIMPPAMKELYEHGQKIGVPVSSFSLPCVYFKNRPEWASIDEGGKVSEYLFGRKVSCPACDPYMEHMLKLLDHVFTRYKPRWWGFDGRWLSYWEVPMYRPGPKGLGLDTCYAKDHGHLPGDNLYKEWKNIQNLLRELRRRHPKVCIEQYLGLKRGGPWALRYLNCDDNYYETNGALMNRFETWHNQNDRFRPVYKNYAAIFGGSLAEFRNNVISSISATSYCQIGPGYKDLALEENRDFLKKWRAWATEHYDYLKVKRDLFGCPGDSPIDGSAHIIKDRGFLFLFPVGQPKVRASIPVNRWLGLDEKPAALYRIREVYPREGADLGVYRYGQEFLYDMPTDSPVILAVEPAPTGSKPQHPALSDPQGRVQIIPAFSSIESHSRAPEPMREQAVQNRNAHNAESAALKSKSPEDSSRPAIINGTDWLDTAGRPILAHDGHITRVGDTFYWYGSSYAGNPQGKYGTAAGFAVWNGIGVYSSRDLVSWKYEGVALPRPKKGWGAVGSVGRAHVIYNEKTRKYVMWYWYHTTYPTVFAMVAASDTPIGPFKVIGAREVGSQTGFASDLNVFKDDDGKAYLVYTDHHTYDASKRFDKGKGVYAILVDSLTDDYTDSKKEGVVAIPSGAEAPAMAKCKGKYIVAASGVQGWNPTDTRYVLADSPLGPYGKPAVMSERKTWGGQITSFLYIKETDTLMAMCDQWWTPDKTDLNKSRYLWLPVSVNRQAGTARMEYHEKWNPFRQSK